MSIPGYGPWPWLALFLLGAYHGINPGMGWLFAVALGLQEKSRRAVFRALPPLTFGHLLSVGSVVAVVALARARVPHFVLRAAAASILIAFGLYRLARSRHPRWVGMHVGFGDLTFWSFLMASAHGAGLMLVPILLGWQRGEHALPAHTITHRMGLSLSPAPIAAFASLGSWLLPVGIHTVGYLLLTVLVALLVYEKLGVAILRRAWFNLDLLWATALVVTGILTFFM